MNICTDILFSWVFFIFMIWLFCYIGKNRQFFRNIPGPPSVSIFRNILNFSKTKDILETFSSYKEKYGSVVKLNFGFWRKALLITDYNILEYIFSSTKLLKKCEHYHFLKSCLGGGLLTDDGEQWKAHRRILNSAFQFEMLEKFLDVFDICGKILVTKLEKDVGKTSVDISQLINLCSLDIIYESTLGLKLNAQTDDNSEFVKNIKSMFKTASEKQSFVQKMLNCLTGDYFKQRKTLHFLHKHIDKIITDRRNKLEHMENGITIAVNGNSEDKRKKCFLDLLLEIRVDGQPLSQEEITKEINTFLFAGYEPTASALSFTLYCLATHPQVQKKVYNEHRSIIGFNNNPSMNYGDFLNMKYLDLVIKESLRLYPPVPIFSRETGTDLEYDNERVPEGLSLIIFVYGIHRDSSYFEDPNVFNPSRFVNVDWTLPYSYLPFSAGPRNCIGQKFAMLALKSVISKIVKKFELLPAQDDLKLTADYVLKSANGVNIGLKLR